MTTLMEVNVARNHLCYCLTESTRDDGSISYGVKVKTTLFGDAEEAAVDDISSEREVAEKFLYMLVDYIVLPSTLTEVAEEYVASNLTV